MSLVFDAAAAAGHDGDLVMVGRRRRRRTNLTHHLIRDASPGAIHVAGVNRDVRYDSLRDMQLA